MELELLGVIIYTGVGILADTRNINWPDQAVSVSSIDCSCPMLLFASCLPDN